jgi:type II secretory pathway pseudopilin PulG
MPLFALIIAVAILGVIAGGVATWFGQRRWRRAARQHEADARSAKAQLAELRSQALAARGEAQRLALPTKGGFFASSGRDKQGAAL